MGENSEYVHVVLLPLHHQLSVRAAHRGPLDRAWAELARKQLKGKDPEETLTWHTPEASGHRLSILPSTYVTYTICLPLPVPLPTTPLCRALQ